MKKTLFLSAILATALCSSAFAETIQVGNQTYNDVTIVTTELNVAPTSDYILIGGTTSNNNGQANYKVTPDSLTATKITGAWVTSLSSEQTLIIAPASTVVSEGAPVNYAGYQTFFDTSDGVAQTINANIIAGGKDDANLLRFWGGNSFTLAGDLTLVGNGVNVWNQAGTHNLTGKIISTESQVLTQVGGSGGTLNLSEADLTEFNGSVKVNAGYVWLHASSVGIGITSGSTLKFKNGSLDEENSTVQYGAAWASSVTANGDGRFNATKNGNQVSLGAGSESELSTITTTGTNGGWLVLNDVGDTENGVFTNVVLNSAYNGIVVGQSGIKAHIGSLSGSTATTEIRGDMNGEGTDRILAVHQNTDTTYAGKFIASSGTMRGRDAGLDKYGTGTLTLTGDNATSKALTLYEGGVTFSGNGHWAGDIDVRQGSLLTISNVSGTFKNIVNAGTVAVTGEHGEVNARDVNGYNTTHDVVTIGGTGTLSGTGAWTLNGVTATLTDGRTLVADVQDTTKYYVDKANADYDSSLKSKYVIAAGKELKATGDVTNIQVKENNGTLVLDNVTGYFIDYQHEFGNVEIKGTLELNNGYSKKSGSKISIATINNLSGTGTIKTTTSSVSERTVITGDVDSTISFSNTRSGGEPTFAFTKDVEKVTINSISNTGSGSLSFEANALVVNSLTLSAGAVGVYAIGSGDVDHDHREVNEVSLTTTTLTVSGNSRLNADLVMAAQGTMDFTSGHVLTMGSTVTIGDGVKVYITGSADDIRYGQEVTIMESVENALTLNNALIFVNGVQQNDFSLKLTDDHRIVVAPEPATATLSLLALAALASRRKRH